MKKWALARYLIDAKKSVDSIIFISQNLLELQGINVRKRVNDCRREFYLNCRIVFDNSYPQKGKSKERKEIKQTDEIVQAILYEADKNYAHKDDKYKRKNYDSLDEEVIILKKQLLHLKEICVDTLPKTVTLDFVPHDRELYRMINKIDINEEERIYKHRHPNYGKDNGNASIGESLIVYPDTEEEIIDVPEKYAVLLQYGINYYEGLQNRQDGCIKFNVLHGKNIWCNFNPLINPKPLK